MSDSERAPSSVEIDIQISEKPSNPAQATDRGERDSVSCIIFPSIALPERNNTASSFLNPASTPRSSFCSQTGSDTSLTTSDGISLLSDTAIGQEVPSYLISLGSISNDFDWHGSAHNSSSVVKSIELGQIKKPTQHNRSESGTPIISGIPNMLPDVIFQGFSPSISRGCAISRPEARQLSISETQKSETSDDDSEENVVTVVETCRTRRPKLIDQSRRGSERHPPKEIWITGGPCPGLYVNLGKAHGRPKWIGKDAKVCWNTEARAWLLMSKNTKHDDAALAMLCVDANHPCITTMKWRVGKGAKKGISYTYYDKYAFKVDYGMSCTRYFGGCEYENKAECSLIADSTLVKIKRGIGIVRFVGVLEDKCGKFAGIELFSPTGLNNGTRKGLMYFEARPKHGVFVRLPGAVEVFGSVSDGIATFIDDILVTARRYKDVSEPAVERLIKIIILVKDWKTLFCKSRLNVLGIILFYDLITR